MTFQEALATLKATQVLSSNLLQPLGLSMDFYLQYSQIAGDIRKVVLKNLIRKLES
tara:strand:+ start:559 stop:726 length:168 start_codon:yes stop_codon:yes gene_type:complete